MTHIPTIQPTFSLLVKNMHCSSCSDTIIDLLSPLKQLRDLSVSLKFHTVTFGLDTSLSSSTSLPSVKTLICDVTETLERNGGFEVASLLPIDNASQLGRAYDRLKRLMTSSFAWPKQDQIQIKEEKPRRHLEYCRACQKESAAIAGTSVDHEGESVARANYSNTSEALDMEAVHPVSTVSTKLAIEGMTCAARTSSVQASLQSHPSVLKVDVDLLASSARIRHEVTVSPSELAELIENIGFGAEIVSSQTEADPSRGKALVRSERLIKTSITVQGMTCASCVSTIERALLERSDIKQVLVDLLAGRAVVTHTEHVVPGEVERLIDSLGYEAETLESVQEAGSKRGHIEVPDYSAARKVVIRLQGMFCEQCVNKVNQHLADFGLLDFTPVTLRLPNTAVSYMPTASLNIRSILDGLSNLSPEFRVELSKPQSLSERSQRIKRRHMRVLIAHLFVAVLFAIPTFIM